MVALYAKYRRKPVNTLWARDEVTEFQIRRYYIGACGLRREFNLKYRSTSMCVDAQTKVRLGERV
jgi:hypothetical protein